MEIERKFLIKKLPYKLKQYPFQEIEQGYLSFAPEVRIRKLNDTYFLTVKGDGTISREEYEIEISEYSYDDFKRKVRGKTLIKRRYLIPLYNNLIAELDVYENFNNLKVVEEVTYNKEFKNKNLVQRNN